MSPAPRVLLLPHACAKVMFIFFYFFLLCCKFALNEYIRGIILKRVIASQPKPPSSLPVGPPGPGYQTDRISHPGGPSSHWRWAAGPVGVPRAPAYQERSPGLLLAGQRALPRSLEVAPSTRLPACGPAPSGELVLACPVPQRPLVCPPPHQPLTWPRTGGGLRVFTGSLQQAVLSPWAGAWVRVRPLACTPGLPAGFCGLARPTVTALPGPRHRWTSRPRLVAQHTPWALVCVRLGLVGAGVPGDTQPGTDP